MVIISLGYRVKSHWGSRFHIWATQVLKEHLVRGYSLNERRLREQNLRLVERIYAHNYKDLKRDKKCEHFLSFYELILYDPIMECFSGLHKIT